jgi:hypothetical protein
MHFLRMPITHRTWYVACAECLKHDFPGFLPTDLQLLNKKVHILLRAADSYLVGRYYKHLQHPRFVAVLTNASHMVTYKTHFNVFFTRIGFLGGLSGFTEFYMHLFHSSLLLKTQDDGQAQRVNDSKCDILSESYKIYFRLLLRCWWDLHSSGILHHVITQKNADPIKL